VASADLPSSEKVVSQIGSGMEKENTNLPEINAVGSLSLARASINISAHAGTGDDNPGNIVSNEYLHMNK